MDLNRPSVDVESIRYMVPQCRDEHTLAKGIDYVVVVKVTDTLAAVGTAWGLLC
jgi:hypothetical protein